MPLLQRVTWHRRNRSVAAYSTHWIGHVAPKQTVAHIWKILFFSRTFSFFETYSFFLNWWKTHCTKANGCPQLDSGIFPMLVRKPMLSPSGIVCSKAMQESVGRTCCVLLLALLAHFNGALLSKTMGGIMRGDSTRQHGRDNQACDIKARERLVARDRLVARERLVANRLVANRLVANRLVARDKRVAKG